MTNRLLARLAAVAPAAVVLLVTLPSYATDGYDDEPPPTDNGKWVGLVAFLVFVAVVGGMLFIANAYRKNNDRR
jgi:hypothetical protein